MTISEKLLHKDTQYIWHPFTALEGEKAPLVISKAQGVYLYTPEGREILDGTSSWWVNLHGHSHPKIAQAIAEQAKTLEHIIFAGFTHEPAINLAEKLLAILPNNQQKVFYSDNGSTSCEVAIKMALQYWYNKGEKARHKIIALEGAYHGDTFGAMSVGGRNAFSTPFTSKLFEVDFLPFPACYQIGCCGGSKQQEKCQSVYGIYGQMERLAQSGEVAAFMYEPIVQGASGMRMYSPEILNTLIEIAQHYGILCIADEVMTGFGRTGKFFASQYCTEKPDIMCLSKGITGGFMPLGVTTCTEEIVSAFRSPEASKTFYHGHSFTANPLACVASIASLELLLQPSCVEAIRQIGHGHISFETSIYKHPKVQQVRTIGTLLAIELRTDEATNYFNSIGKSVYHYFLDKNILLRPLGNVLYVMPPYVINEQEMERIYSAIRTFLDQC